ncbi:MAG: DoxX family protein [Panacagrimonas sp.]
MRADVHAVVASQPWVLRLASAALCTAYVYSGVSKLLNFDAALGEAAHFGLNPPAVFAIAVILTQLGGSALTVFASGRWQALGAVALAGFTVVATVIGHPFWTKEGMDRFHNRNSFLEHIGLVGGFLLVAALALPRRAAGS